MKKRLLLILVLVTTTVAILILLISAILQPRVVAPGVVPPAGEVTVVGKIVCLPHLITDGPTTLECAYGLMDETGRYFALRDTSQDYQQIGTAPMDTRVTIKGNFTPEASTIYQSIGRIDVTAVTY